ncbi:hypothetical protein TNCV_1894051 [Trichonephila clavipes]|nr:hypothetical protein TNCV_1894051 [Trichonephila clavipes]
MLAPPRRVTTPPQECAPQFENHFFKEYWFILVYEMSVPSVHICRVPVYCARTVFSGTRLQFMTRWPRIHYLDHNATSSLSGIRASDADCYAVRPSQIPENTWMLVNVHCFCGMGYSKQPSSRKSYREIGGRGREVGGSSPCLKIGMEPS